MVCAASANTCSFPAFCRLEYAFSLGYQTALRVWRPFHSSPSWRHVLPSSPPPPFFFPPSFFFLYNSERLFTISWLGILKGVSQLTAGAQVDECRTAQRSIMSGFSSLQMTTTSIIFIYIIKQLELMEPKNKWHVESRSLKGLGD